MSLLLQLNGELHERFPGHERRLYVWACRKKTCRRKDGSVRGFRATRQTAVSPEEATVAVQQHAAAPPAPPNNLGETLFGVKPIATGSANPFAAPQQSNNSTPSNPFASASSLAAKPPQKPDPPPEPATTETLPHTFAEKARLAGPDRSEPAPPSSPAEPWPETSAFPAPYPTYYVDAEKEYIDPEPAAMPAQNVRVDTGDGPSSVAEDKAAFESAMDKTFQRFADRLAQNPEQILRYEFGGQPLLYSRTDAVGKKLDPAGKDAKVKTSGAGKIPRCTNCGAERVFELQLTPHAITELEAEELSLDGMDWGTILLGSCSKDCQEKGKKDGEVGYVEEWVGVQWEELTGKKSA
jgi:pre-rRNA-processing protein TSR4